MFECFGRGLRENVCNRIEGFLEKEKNREYEEYVRLLEKGRYVKKEGLGIEESMVRNSSAIY